ncbi:unnamed protein product [Ascophyllum nodosum]
MRERASTRQGKAVPKDRPEVLKHVSQADEYEDIPQTGVLSIEGKATYMKLQGLNLLHSAEMVHLHELLVLECEGMAAKALDAYLAAHEALNDYRQSGIVPKLHPTRLEPALKI